MTIRDAIGREESRFDLLCGDEDYKYRFGAADSFIRQVRLGFGAVKLPASF